MDNQPYLIYYQGPADNPNPQLGALDRTNSILANLEHIESLPLDGLVVNVPAAWFVMKNQNLDYENYFGKWLRPLQGKLQNLDQNFLLAQIDRPGDPFDDWSKTLDNWRKMARAAKEFGYKGIFFDNEEYGGRILNYPNDLNYTNIYSLEQYRSQMRLRGRQIMETITSEFPEIVLFNNRGPYKSVENIPGYVKSDSSDEVELLGSLFVGFLEGATPQSTIIDGGQIYDYRTSNDFEQSYEWRKNDIVSNQGNLGNEFIPQNIKNNWSSKVDVSFGVFNQPYASLDSELGDMTPASLQSTLTNALNTGDKYVWLYAEQDTWLAPGGVGRAWIDATARARNNATGQTFNNVNVPTTNNQVPNNQVPRVENIVEPDNTEDSNSDNSFGTNGKNSLFGTRASEQLNGSAKNDVIYGYDGSDVIRGNRGFDTLYGGNGDDTISAQRGDDVIDGGSHDDYLMGNSGYDRIDGDYGKDRLVGGWGLDTLIGGPNSDLFVIQAGLGADTITDFENNSDRLVLKGSLEYSDLKFNAVNGDLIISSNGKNLAILLNTNANAIDRSDFIVE